jgi:cell division topological specificity factor
MFDFFNKLFNPSPPSGATAKERLRLVLLSDHLALAPDVIDALKRDLLAVISRYVEIDGAHADVTFEHREGEVAMLASIPITGVRDRGRTEPSPPIAPSPELAKVESGAGETRSERASDVPSAAANATVAMASDVMSASAPADGVAANATLAGVAESVAATETSRDEGQAIAGALAAIAADGGSAASPGVPNPPAPRRRRRRKSAAAKRAAQQAIAFGTPAQA